MSSAAATYQTHPHGAPSGDRPIHSTYIKYIAPYEESPSRRSKKVNVNAPARCWVKLVQRAPPHVAHTDLDIYYNNNLVRLKGASGEVFAEE